MQHPVLAVTVYSKSKTVGGQDVILEYSNVVSPLLQPQELRGASAMQITPGIS